LVLEANGGPTQVAAVYAGAVGRATREEVDHMRRSYGINRLHALTLIRQDAPKQVNTRFELGQPGRQAFEHLSPAEGELHVAGLHFYQVVNAMIYYRHPGVRRLAAEDMMARASACSNGGAGLLFEAFERQATEYEATAAKTRAAEKQRAADAAAAALANGTTVGAVNISEMLAKRARDAQRCASFASKGEDGKAWGVYGRTSVGDPSDKARRAGYEANTVKAPPPLDVCMADVDGAETFSLLYDVFEAVAGSTPKARMGGAGHDTYEGVDSLFHHGARAPLYRFLKAMCAGELPDEFKPYTNTLLGLMVLKLDGTDRPLGVPEALRRVAARCMARQDKMLLNDFYLGDLPENVRMQAADVAEAQSALEGAQSAHEEATAAGGDESETAANVAEAEKAVADAEAPRKIPVNFVFAPRGGQALAACVELVMDEHPTHHFIDDDIMAMYNKTSRSGGFAMLQRRTPGWVPATRYFYGDPQSIVILRSEGRMRSQLAVEAEGDDGDGELRVAGGGARAPPGAENAGGRFAMEEHPDLVYQATAAGLTPQQVEDAIARAISRAPDAAFVWSCAGGNQGDPLATHFCCGQTHEVMHELQRRYRDVFILGIADDNTYCGCARALYGEGGFFEEKKAMVWQRLRQQSNLAKVQASTPSGDESLIPPTIKRAEVLKVAGCYIPARATEAGEQVCKDRLEARITKRLTNYTNLKLMADSTKVGNTTQLKMRMLRKCGTRALSYFTSAMRPSRTEAAARHSDKEGLTFFLDLVHAAASPAERAVLAGKQAFLQEGSGGAGLFPQERMRDASFSACFLGTWPLVRRCLPFLSAHSLAASELPTIVAAREAYARVVSVHDSVLAQYADFDLETYHALDGRVLPRFRPKGAPPPPQTPPPRGPRPSHPPLSRSRSLTHRLRTPTAFTHAPHSGSCRPSSTTRCGSSTLHACAPSTTRTTRRWTRRRGRASGMFATASPQGWSTTRSTSRA
jgi:hypothetical protein